MKKLQNEQLTTVKAGGCDFFTSLGCGLAIGATMSGWGIIAAAGAVAACGSLYNDCRG